MKNAVWYICVCIAALAAGAYIGFLPHATGETSQPAPTPTPLLATIPESTPTPTQQPDSLASQDTASERYIIRGADSSISVFKLYSDGTEQLEYSIDTDLYALRQVDREQLLKGIIVMDEKNVAALLEDFLS